MSESTFLVDGFDNISLIEGVLRIELVALSQPAGSTQPQPHKAGTLAMSLQGFLRATEQMNQVVNKMVEQGILKRNDPPPTTPEAGTKLN